MLYEALHLTAAVYVKFIAQTRSSTINTATITLAMFSPYKMIMMTAVANSDTFIVNCK